MDTRELHTDVFYTPRGLTAYATLEDLDITERANRLVKLQGGRQVRRYVLKDILNSMLDAERADRFSYGPSLTTMVDYVTADVHKQCVEQALAVRS